MAKIYKTFDHTADLGIEVYGKDQRALFINAGYALFDLITDLDKIEVKTSLSLTLEAVDREDWLRAVDQSGVWPDQRRSGHRLEIASQSTQRDILDQYLMRS